MLCLNYKMMQHNQVCEECRNGKYYRCALNRCVKDSFAKSCVNVAEGYLHKWRHSYDAIGEIITPSAFYKEMFEKFGINSSRVMHIPNFIDVARPEITALNDREKYYLYFGRLSEEKGIMTLLKAVENTKLQLKIVGTGPSEEEVRNYVHMHKMDNVKLLGFKSGKELSDVIGNAKAVILPSEWYENGPYSAIEALQLGRPIVGADIGGIPELVDKNGFLFESGNDRMLKEKLLEIEKMNDEQYCALVENSFKIFDECYTSDKHFALLKEAYRSVGVTGL